MSPDACSANIAAGGGGGGGPLSKKLTMLALGAELSRSS